MRSKAEDLKNALKRLEMTARAYEEIVADENTNYSSGGVFKYKRTTKEALEKASRVLDCFCQQVSLGEQKED